MMRAMDVERHGSGGERCGRRGIVLYSFAGELLKAAHGGREGINGVRVYLCYTFKKTGRKMDVS